MTNDFNFNDDLTEWFKHNILLNDSKILGISGGKLDNLFDSNNIMTSLDKYIQNISKDKRDILNKIMDGLQDPNKQKDTYIFLKKLDTLIQDYTMVNIPLKNTNDNTNVKFESVKDATNFDYKVINTSFGKKVVKLKDIQPVKTNLTQNDVMLLKNNKQLSKDLLGQTIYNIMFQGDKTYQIKTNKLVDSLQDSEFNIEPIHLENILNVINNLSVEELDRIYKSDINDFSKIRMEYINRADEMQKEYFKELSTLHSHKAGILQFYSDPDNFGTGENIVFKIFSYICKYGITGVIVGGTIGLGKNFISLTTINPKHVYSGSKFALKKLVSGIPDILGGINDNSSIDDWNRFFKETEASRVDYRTRNLNFANIGEFSNFTKYRLITHKLYAQSIDKYIKDNNIKQDKIFENRELILKNCIHNSKSYNRLILEIGGLGHLKNFENVVISEYMIVPKIKEYISNKTHNDIVFIPMLDESSEFYGLYIPINRRTDNVSIDDLKLLYKDFMTSVAIEKFIKVANNSLKNNEFYKNYSHNAILEGSIPIVYANTKYNIGYNKVVPYDEYKELLLNNINIINTKLNIPFNLSNVNIDNIVVNLENMKYDIGNFNFNDISLEHSYVYLRDEIIKSNHSDDIKSQMLNELDNMMLDDYININNPIYNDDDSLNSVDFNNFDYNSDIDIIIDSKHLTLNINEINLIDKLKDKLVDVDYNTRVDVLKPYLNEPNINMDRIISYLDIENKSSSYNLKNLKDSTLYPNMSEYQVEFLESNLFNDFLVDNFKQGIIPTSIDLKNTLNIDDSLISNDDLARYINVKYNNYMINVKEVSTIDNNYVTNKDLLINDILNEHNQNLELNYKNLDNVLPDINKSTLEKLMKITPIYNKVDMDIFTTLGTQLLNDLASVYKKSKDDNENYNMEINNTYNNIINREDDDSNPYLVQTIQDDTILVKNILSKYVSDVDNIYNVKVNIFEKDNFIFNYDIELNMLDNTSQHIKGDFDITSNIDDVDGINKFRSYLLNYNMLDDVNKNIVILNIIDKHLTHKDDLFIKDNVDLLNSNYNSNYKINNSNNITIEEYLNNKIVNLDNNIKSTLILIGYSDKQLIKYIKDMLKSNNMAANKENIDKIIKDLSIKLKNPLDSTSMDELNTLLKNIANNNYKIDYDNLDISKDILNKISHKFNDIFKELNHPNIFNKMLNDINKLDLDKKLDVNKKIKLTNKPKLEVTSKTKKYYNKLKELLRKLNRYINREISLKQVENSNVKKLNNKHKINIPPIDVRDYESNIKSQILSIKEYNTELNHQKNLNIEKNKDVKTNSLSVIVNKQVENKAKLDSYVAKIEEENLNIKLESDRAYEESINNLRKELKKSDKDLETMIINKKNRQTINETIEDINDLRKSKSAKQEVVEEVLNTNVL